MKRFGLLFALLLAACLAVQPLRAQDAKKPEPKPAPSPSQALLEQWNDIGRKLIAMAEDFPNIFRVSGQRLGPKASNLVR